MPMQVLAQYGLRPSVLEQVEEAKRARLLNRLGELQIQQVQMANTKQGRLADLYQRHTMGDQGALAEIAGVDRDVHMQLQDRMLAMDETTRKRAVQQSIGLSQQILAARQNPQMQGELQQRMGITPDQYDAVLARTAAIPEVYTQIVNADQQRYTRDHNQSQQELQRRGQDITLRGQDLANARAVDATNLASGAESFKDANTLRDEFNAGSKDFVQIRDAYSRIQASAQNPSAAGDLALIFNYMKLLDPGSVVREGEFATAQNASGVPGRILSMYNNVVRGERLNPAQRMDFLRQSEGLYTAQEQGHAQLMSEYERLAKQRGLNPQDVLVDYRYQGQAAPVPAAEETKQLNGKTYYKINGQWWEQ